jgi:hypothetical protein
VGASPEELAGVVAVGVVAVGVVAVVSVGVVVAGTVVAGGGVVVAAVTWSSKKPWLVAALNSREACPSDRASFGSLFEPKINSPMTRMMSSSGAPISTIPPRQRPRRPGRRPAGRRSMAGRSKERTGHIRRGVFVRSSAFPELRTTF